MARVQNGFGRHVSVPTLRWHLALLGVSGVALSVASGWTTWDGMANFTHNPVLSFLITFGIQSVMLISAWMIGETLANPVKADATASKRTGKGMRDAGSHSNGTQGSGLFRLKSVLAWAVLLACSIGLLSEAAALYVTDQLFRYGLAVAAVVAGAVLVRKALHALGHGEIVRPYERSATAILRNLPLWGMFLVCLSASVFFSFDSLFDKIYSSRDRETASRSRLQAHVTGLLSDLQDELEAVRHNAIAALHESPQWLAFDRQLGLLPAAVDRTRTEIERQHTEQATALTARLGDEVAERTAARAEANVIDNRLEREQAELERVERDLAEARSSWRKLDLTLTEQRLQADGKGEQAAAEAAGNGITQLVGRGQKYRQLKAEEAAFRIEADQTAVKLAAARKMIERLDEERAAVAERVGAMRTARSQAASRIARAEWQIDHASPQDGPAGDLLARLSPALVTLEGAKAGFLNRPTRQSYSALETQCAGLTGLLRTAGENGSHVASVRCGTLAGSQTLLNVFAANTALAKFQEGCGKTRKLTGLSSDEIFQAGQSCIQLSGLHSAIAGEFLTGLRQVAMRRDDRAHRFVVTWNAFFDTNPLAFVALFIALSIDGLVFITGLFGASAEAGLRMVPGRKPSRRHAHALSESRSEAVLDFALLPDVTGTARLLLEHLVPAPLGRSSGLAGEIDLLAVPDEKVECLRTVLNTACTLRLAERPESGDRYVLRTGLIDHLSERLGWQRGVSAGTWVECNPEEMLAVALGRQRRRIGQAILEHAQPVSVEADHAYALEIADCPVSMQGRITSVLNTAVAGGTVSGDPASERRYLLTAAFVSLLTRLAAGESYGETGADDAAEPADLPSFDTPEQSVSSAASERISEHFVADTFGESGPDADVGFQVPDAASEKRPEKPNTVPGLAHDERQSQALAELHDEAPVSSKLITFPIDSRTRQQNGPDLKSGQAQSGQAQSGQAQSGQAQSGQAQSGQAQSGQAQSGQAQSGQAQTEFGDDLLADRETLEKAVSDLVAGSSIAPHEAIGWFRSGAGPKFDDGWTCIRQMCLDDRQFETELAGCELKARRKIDRFREALKAGDAVGPGETDGSAPESEPDPAIRVYRPYLMRRYAMDMAMAWCMNALREFEDNAVFGADAKAREQQLQTIEDIAARLSPLDEEHCHEWSEIGMRAGGLGRQDSELEAFSDLMP